MLKRIWLIWARTVDHRIGKTDDDKPDIPILTNKDAGYRLLISLWFPVRESSLYVGH